MGIRDNDINFARHRLYVPVSQFQGLIPINAAPGSQTTSDLLTSVADSAPTLIEFGTLGFTGLQCGVADSIQHVMEFPSFWDIESEIGVRVWWTAFPVTSLAVTDTATWLFRYDQADEGEQLTGQPTTALNKAITADAYGGTLTGIWMRSPRGIINPRTFDRAALDGILRFEVELDATNDFEAAEVYLMGVSFDYLPSVALGVQHGTELSRI